MSLVLDARTATPHFPGIGRYVTNLAHALQPLVSDLQLLTQPQTPTQALPNAPHIVCSASPFSLTQQWRVPTALRRARATLYHSPYYLMPYAPGLPTVLTVYDLIPLLCPHDYTAAQRLIFRAAHTLALNTARVVLAISEATRRDIARWFRVPAEKITVTPLAADPHFRPAAPQAITALRHKLGLPDNYLLYFGSNKPHKNLVRLMEAFGKLQTSNHKPQTTLVVAGYWDARYPEAKQVAEQRGWADRVKFIGPVAEADLPALYSGAQWFVFPSEYEGFGLPVLEALACGAPVICSNASSLPEVAGEAAVYFDPADTDKLIETLRQALTTEGLQAQLRQRGLARAAHFSWTKTAQITQRVYSDLISNL